MSSPSSSGQFQPGVDILGSSVSETTNKILLQTGSNVGEGQTDCDNVELLQHVGFASRPADPEKGKAAAQAFVFCQGGQDIALASQDLRGMAVYGNLKAGETCVYAIGEDGTAQGRILIKGDGSINLYTRKGNAPAGAGMVVQVDALNGAIRLLNNKGYGIVIDQDGVKITAGNAGLTLNGNGSISLVGTGKCQLDGGSICLGSKAVPGVNSALCGVAGLVGVASTKVFIDIA